MSDWFHRRSWMERRDVSYAALPRKAAALWLWVPVARIAAVDGLNHPVFFTCPPLTMHVREHLSPWSSLPSRVIFFITNGFVMSFSWIMCWLMVKSPQSGQIWKPPAARGPCFFFFFQEKLLLFLILLLIIKAGDKAAFPLPHPSGALLKENSFFRTRWKVTPKENLLRHHRLCLHWVPLFLILCIIFPLKRIHGYCRTFMNVIKNVGHMEKWKIQVVLLPKDNHC